MQNIRLNERTQEYEYSISRNINLLSDLVDELLSYARFDRQGLKFDMKVLSLYDSSVRVIAAIDVVDKATLFYSEEWLYIDPTRQVICFEPKHLERAIQTVVDTT